MPEATPMPIALAHDYDFTGSLFRGDRGPGEIIFYEVVRASTVSGLDDPAVCDCCTNTVPLVKAWYVPPICGSGDGSALLECHECLLSDVRHPEETGTAFYLPVRGV